MNSRIILSLPSPCIRAVALALTVLHSLANQAAAFEREQLARLVETKECVECLLEGSDLSSRDLSHAKLQRAILRKSNFASSKLQATDLTGADLSGAYLLSADLSNSSLINADLTEAVLNGANLAGASLIAADLTRADLWSTNLATAQLNRTTLTDASFEPSAVPSADNLLLIHGLSTLRWSNSPLGLTLLRGVFRESGMRWEERQVTYALKRWDREGFGCLSRGGLHNTECKLRTTSGQFWSFVDYFLFELTSNYGMSPGKPLAILFALVPVFAILYAVAIVAPLTPDAGIWAVWSKDRVLNAGKIIEPQRISLSTMRSSRRWQPFCKIPMVALYFSLLSAFHIGWRELNVGDWLSRLSPRERVLRPTGWVRSVAGVQSLISVYLLALSALTYFARPFG